MVAKRLQQPVPVYGIRERYGREIGIEVGRGRTGYYMCNDYPRYYDMGNGYSITGEYHAIIPLYGDIV